MAKVRLDVLVQRTAGVSRSKAQGLIHTGNVFAGDGKCLKKPAMRIEEDTELLVKAGARYVSRGGLKLEHALLEFDIDVTDVIAIDAGASTGGFTDCLIQHGAATVYAVDVGYGQLDWKLRQDDRVVVLERSNIRHLKPERLSKIPDFFCADCSFISLKLVLPALKLLSSETARGVLLIKPQFEAGKNSVGKGGVVRDPKVHERVIDDVTTYAADLGFDVIGVTPSPLLGPAGNREFLTYLKLS